MQRSWETTLTMENQMEKLDMETAGLAGYVGIRVDMKGVEKTMETNIWLGLFRDYYKDPLLVSC